MGVGGGKVGLFLLAYTNPRRLFFAIELAQSWFFDTGHGVVVIHVHALCSRPSAEVACVIVEAYIYTSRAS